jgi:predicted deacylase
MKQLLVFLVTLLITAPLFSQEGNAPIVKNLDLESLESGKIHTLWLSLAENHLSNPINIPVLVAKGKGNGPVLGITAAIHGNELNGIAIIHELFKAIDPQNLQGTMIAIPGLNPLAIANNQREFSDGVDLNRIFPGKANGGQSEQMAYKIGQKVISFLDYHVDLHTASFGRANSLYGRGDMQNDTLANMLRALAPDIIVSNKGKASFGSASGLTMRAFAIEKGVKSITVEYGNPQVYQNEMIKRGVGGLQNMMVYLNFLKGDAELSKEVKVCSKSYWIHTDKGGYLDVLVDLNQKMKENETLAVLRNSFGEVIETYKAPEDGIIVGKSTNPVAISGSRIVHLGILE